MPVGSSIRLAALTALVAAPTASAQVAFPGFTNPGCESQIFELPTGWISTPGGMQCRNGDAFGGPQAREGSLAFLNSAGPPTTDMALTQRIVANNALAGRTVTFTAYGSRIPGDADTGALTLAFFGRVNGQAGPIEQIGTTTTVNVAPVSGAWTKYTVVAVAPAGASQVEVGMRCIANAQDFCDLLWDDTALTLDQELPVELVAFTAVATANGARLAWATASETDNSGFVVEQQRGGEWAEASAFIAGRGTTSEHTDYAVDVTGLTAGRHTFRLRQTDLDGTTTHSAPVTVEIGAPGGHRVTLLGSRAVRVEGDEQPVRVTIYDLLGRETWSASEQVSGTIEVPLPVLARGAYVVRVTGTRFSDSQMLIVR